VDNLAAKRHKELKKMNERMAGFDLNTLVFFAFLCG
jgi:hypothetical protein